MREQVREKQISKQKASDYRYILALVIYSYTKINPKLGALNNNHWWSHNFYGSEVLA